MLCSQIVMKQQLVHPYKSAFIWMESVGNKVNWKGKVQTDNEHVVQNV